MRKVGVGVIGCGFIGTKAHLPAFRAIPEADVVAVSDKNEERGKKAAHKFNAKYFSKYVDLVEDPQVEAVVIAVPTFLHPEMCIHAAEAGKHILCEMPLAPTLKEVDVMIEAAEKAGVIFMPGLTFRFTPNFVKVKEIIDSGLIGTPAAIFYREFIAAETLSEQWPPGSWAWDEKRSGKGGPAFTLSVYAIDLLRWLSEAEIIRVYSSLRSVPLEKLGTRGYVSLALITFANGTIGTLQFSGLVTSVMESSELEIIGENTQGLCALGNDTVVLYGEEPNKSEWHFKEKGARAWGHQQEDEHFIKCIINGKKPSITSRDARRAQEVALQIIESAKKGV